MQDAVSDLEVDSGAGTERGKLSDTTRKTDAQLRMENLIAGAVVVLPPLGTLAALWHGSEYGVSTFDIGLAVVFFSVPLVGVTLGLHRLFTHKAYDASPGLRATLAVAASFGLQGPVIRWVADHRRHHKYSDKEGDVHSPHTNRGRWRWVRFLDAHMGYFFNRYRTTVRRFAPDLLADTAIVKIDSLYPLWALLSLGLPPVLGFLVTGTGQGALSALLWAGFARLFLSYHCTWFVNSIGHVVGTRPYNTPDSSRNNAFVNLGTFGEGWHNNHHAFPSSARLGLRWWQWDIGWMVLCVFRWLGLATNIKLPPAWYKRGRTRASAGPAFESNAAASVLEAPQPRPQIRDL